MKSDQYEGRLYGFCSERVLISPPRHSNANSGSVFEFCTNLRERRTEAPVHIQFLVQIHRWKVRVPLLWRWTQIPTRINDNNTLVYS